jgi:hypothetical protein
MNYPIGWKDSEEHAYFAKALELGEESREARWIGSQILQLMVSKLLGLNLIFVNELLAALVNMSIFMFMYILASIYIDKRYCYLFPTIYMLSAVSEYRYFSTQLLAFSLGLLVIWIIASGIKSPSKKFMLILIAVTLTVTHSITPLLFLFFVSNYVLTLLLVRRKRKNKGSMAIYLLIIIIFISYNIYNSYIYINYHITQLEKTKYPTPLMFPYHRNYPYLSLYLSRYLYFAVIIVTSLIGLYEAIRSKMYDMLRLMLSFAFAIAFLWPSLIIFYHENYSNRFIMFGMIPSSLFSTYALSKVKQVRKLKYFFLSFLLISFAISLFPSAYLKLQHEWQFEIAEFYTERGIDNTIITDTFMGNFIHFSSPIARVEEYLAQVTVYGRAPKDLILPAGIILRSITYDIQTYVNYHTNSSDWRFFDFKLNADYNLCYDNYFGKLYYR